MNAKIVILFLLTLLLTPLAVNAEPMSPVKKLDHISDEALQMVKLQRYEDAKKLLDYFSNQFVTIKTEERPFTMDELRIITVAHHEAVEAAASVEMNYDERMNRVTKFRLVMDALTSSRQPLWAEMKEPVMTVFNEVKTAAYGGDSDRFHAKLNSFLSLYDVIYPSMKIDIAAERLQTLDSRVTFIDHYRQQVLTSASSQEELEALGADLTNIFDEMTEDEADPSLWWVMFSTGSIIILTLSYVGWRKYKGDQEKKRTLKKELKD